MSSFNFQFLITLAASNTDFYAKYSDFLTALARFVGGNTNAITIKSIGSTAVQSSQSQLSFNVLSSTSTT